jgi:putative FmdB family regulatory protein
MRFNPFGDETMPIYEYRCSSCGHQQEFLQKVSDAPLTTCTACGKPDFSKMLTAAGFQLKGSGWYATDFKSKPAAAKSGDAKPDTKTDSSSDSGGSTGHACGSGACSACS